MYFIIYRLKLLIPPSNTTLKLLVILFVIKLYARTNIFRYIRVFVKRRSIFEKAAFMAKQKTFIVGQSNKLTFSLKLWQTLIMVLHKM